MARIGKIARLPRPVRIQLNSRLLDGAEGKQVLQWLNSLPLVKRILDADFNGRPVSEQNLSEWRQGGYEEWRAQQDLLAQAAELAANRRELQTVAPGQSPADLLAAAISFRYGAILAGQGPELDDKSLTQLKSLGRICQAVVKLRRSDQNAARLKIETERWELAQERIRSENEEETKRKLRAALAAPVLAMMKMPEWLDKLGGGMAAQVGVQYLAEVEACQDPAHFSSKIMASKTKEEWDLFLKEATEQIKNRKTPMQEALDTYHEMKAGLGIRRAKGKDAKTQPRSKSCPPADKPVEPQPRQAKSKTPRSKKRRHPAKPAAPQARRDKAPMQPVQRTETAQPADNVQPSPAPAPQNNPAPSAPDSGLSPTSTSVGPEASIQPNPGIFSMRIQ